MCTVIHRVLLIALVLLAGSARAATERPKRVVMPLQIDATAKRVLPKIIEELVLTAVHSTRQFDAIGPGDVNAALTHAANLGLLGCDDPRRFGDVSRALAAQKLLVVSIALVGDQWLVVSKLLDTGSLRVESRGSRFIAGDLEHLVDEMPAVMTELFAGGGYGTSTGTAAATPTRPSTGYHRRLGQAKDCEEQCTAGHPGSCYVLAYMHEKGLGTANDDAGAAALYERLCKEGHQPACAAGTQMDAADEARRWE
jgi:hypothetical protein